MVCRSSSGTDRCPVGTDVCSSELTAAGSGVMFACLVRFCRSALRLSPAAWYRACTPLLKSAGLAALIHFWLASTSLVLYTLFFVVTWQFIGFGIVLLLAGLQGIPPELREAAAIDGATSWQVTRRIMLPLLGPTIRIWIFLAVIGSLQLFDIVWIMTLGGPANASQTMLTYLYFNGAERTQFGYGATISVVLFIISFVFALAYQRYALRRDTAGALTRAVG